MIYVEYNFKKCIRDFQASIFVKYPIDRGFDIFQRMGEDNPSLVDVIRIDSAGKNLRQEIRQLVLCLVSKLAK